MFHLLEILSKIASGGDFGHIVNESRSFELDKVSNILYEQVQIQSDLDKIKKTEGYDTVLDFLNDMLEYR